MSLDQAVPMLRAELDRIRSKAADPVDRNLDQIAASKRRVIGHDGPVFAPGGVGQLDRDTFLEFLRIENNEHWSGINRSGAQIASDMPRPRRALALLVDEQVPPRQRLDQLYPRGGPATVGSLGPAILTPILQVVYPDEYGVRNGITEAGMRRSGPGPCRRPRRRSPSSTSPSMGSCCGWRPSRRSTCGPWTTSGGSERPAGRRARRQDLALRLPPMRGRPRRSRGPRGPSSHGWSCCRAGSGSRWKLPGTGCCGSSAGSTPTTMASPTPNPTESSRSTCWPRSR